MPVVFYNLPTSVFDLREPSLLSDRRVIWCLDVLECDLFFTPSVGEYGVWWYFGANEEFQDLAVPLKELFHVQ